MTTPSRWTLFGLLLLLWLPRLAAIESVQLRIDNWSYEDLAAAGFEVDLALNAWGLVLDARADSVKLPAPAGRVEQVSLHCEDLQPVSGGFHCDSGRLSFRHPHLGAQQLDFSLQSRSGEGRYQLRLQGLNIAGGEVDLQASIQPGHWRVDIDGNALDMQSLLAQLSPWLDASQLSLIADWEFGGQLALQAQLQGKGAQFQRVDFDLHGKALDLANAAGNFITEGLTARAEGEFVHEAGTWAGQTQVQLSDGQAYVEPIFIDLAANPLTLDGQGQWRPALQKLDVTRLDLHQQGVVSLQTQFLMEQGRLARLSALSAPAELSRLYPVWLQPFAYGTAADSLQTTGRVAVELELDEGDIRLQLSADAVSLIDADQRFALEGLDGTMGWSSTAQPVQSEIAWDRASLYALPLGGAQLVARSQTNSVTLMQELVLPVLDGELVINGFDLILSANAGVSWSFEGLLAPVSMDALSDALGWPLLHGKLSGVIPKVSYQDQDIEVEGALQLKLFDGVTVIRDLRLLSPLGSLPQLYANIDISRIDLDLLTRTFDFGRITGRLDGHVHNLRLANWQPVQFDARFATAEQEPGRRRISQKAVDNLSQIGGGATGVLSRSFLRFFDDFAYDRIGLSCRLRNRVCDMSGVEDAEQGYYIVKGGGGLPPWINVVGYTRRVDWPDLIERLKAVSDSSGPVIQ